MQIHVDICMLLCFYDYVLICCYGSETGEFCAIKEVEFVRDDPKSKESAKQLAQVSKISPACLYIVFFHKIVSRILTLFWVQICRKLCY